MKKEVFLKEQNEKFLEVMRGQIKDKFLFQTIISSEIEIKEVDDENVFFSVPNKDARIILREYLIELITTAIENIFGKKKVVFLEDQKILIKEMKDHFSKANSKSKNTDSNLIPFFTFDNLVSVDYNKRAIKASLEILDNEDIIFSPLFIHSNSGLGKTHIINAIGNKFVEKGKTVKYIDSNHFTKEISSKLINRESQDINDIVDKMNEYDVLIFDDIQNFGNKPATLNVLFNIINNSIVKRKQIIIAADKNVDQLGGFEERFITRFAGGLTTELTKPSNDDLIKIWKFKLMNEGLTEVNWDDESLKFISRNFQRSIRDLEGALNLIKFHSKENPNIKYTYAVVRNIFNNERHKKENVTPEKIIKIVAEYYKLKPNEIVGTSRKKEIHIARSIAIWIIRNQLEFKYKRIGEIFGGKDHTTIINSVNKIDKIQKEDQQVKYALNKIEKNINKLN